MRKNSGIYECRMYLASSLVRGRQPHLGEPEALKVRNCLLKKVPPAQLRVFAIPGKELDLSEE
jgi:hypothetical protein